MRNAGWSRGALVVAGAGLVLGAGALARRARRFELRGRVAVVTGGSRGLGLVLARELVARGARVAICARDKQELARAAADLRQRGGEVLDVVCNVAKPGELEDMLAGVRTAFGSIDVLVNNAGVIQVGPLSLQTEADFQECMDVHFWAPLRATLAVLPDMVARRSGRIVNIASIGGKIGLPHMAPYCASKSALIGLSTALRSEVARDGVAITTVTPGLIRTGSHVNARFKLRDDYDWFSSANSRLLVSTSAERAARSILRAMQEGRAELVLPLSMKLALRLHDFLPETAARVVSGANRFLPDVDGESPVDQRGLHCRRVGSAASTARSDRAAVRNNEVSPEERASLAP